MCTLVVGIRQLGLPLVVAANRDERLDRAATGPRRWPGTSFVAPRDEVAGGTWLGLTASGMFVGVTNRFGAPRDAARESRGALVVEALGRGSAREVHASLADLDARRFNAFHLLYADRDAAFVTWSDGAIVRRHQLGPGLHVVTERSLGGDDRARTELAAALWAPIAAAGKPDVPALESLLRQHRPDDPLGGTCVHLPAFNYGTRSSLVLLLGETRPATRLFWAEGPPCTAPFVERPDLVAAFGYLPAR